MSDPNTSNSDSQTSVSKPDSNERDAGASRFGLHPLVIAVVVIYFLLFIGGSVGISIWRDRPDLIDSLFGNVLINAFIIGIPSWLVWRVSRSRLAGNITCTLIVSLLLVVFGSAFVTTRDRAQKNNVAMDTFLNDTDSRRQDQAELLDRAIAGEDVSEESLENFDQSIQSLEQLSDQSSGDQAKVFSIMAEVMKRLEQPFSNYNDSLNQLFEAGSVDPATLVGPEAITDRLHMVEVFDAANERLDKVYASLETDFRTRLRADNLGDEMIEFVIKNWKQGARPDLIAKIRQTDRDLVVSLRGILNTLAEAEGLWSVDGELVVIEDDALREQYTTHYDRMIEVSELQEDLQRQVQEAVNSQQATP